MIWCGFLSRPRMNKAEGACCEWCGRGYERCAFNGHRQKYCREDSCVRERKRARQRPWYKSKYRNDPTFRKAEQARCLKVRQTGRTTAAQNTDKAEKSPSAEMLFFILTGLLAHLADSDDASALAETSRALGRRGQRLAVPMYPSSVGGPKASVEEIFRPSTEAGRRVPRQPL